MTQATAEQVVAYGRPLVERIIAELNAVPDENFAHMNEIRNLEGRVTGFAHVYTADRVRRLSHLSIEIMPGMRYFNMMACTGDNIDAPRFMHEGMISVHGSQLSTDLFHGIDMEDRVKDILARTAGVTEIYNEAVATDIKIMPSRQVHMRIFASPHFLCAFEVNGEQLPRVADFADRYLSEWLKMLRGANELDAVATGERRRRRTHMSNMMVELDPDRHMVVKVYGEDTVQAIEEACMY